MTKLTKTLLVLSVIGILLGLAFVTGLVNVSNAVWLYVTLPAGAIFFGLFLISRILEEETSRYDQEQRTLADRANSVAPKKSSDAVPSVPPREPPPKSRPA